MISDKFNQNGFFFILQLVIQIFQLHGTYINLSKTQQITNTSDRETETIVHFGKVREKGDKPGTCSQ